MRLEEKVISKKNYDKFLIFLKDHKKLVGLSDWCVTLKESYEYIGDVLAEVKTDFYEKELVVTLSSDFEELSVNKQKNVLLHELVHGRIEIYNKKKDFYLDELEELLVNDLVRGFERHKNLKWKEDQKKRFLEVL